MQNEDPTFKPRINNKSKFLKRSSSTGNITAELYNMAAENKKKKVDMEFMSVMSLKVSSHQTVLANAGIAEGIVTNSDKYQANRLQREFDGILTEL